jgi:DNA-binding GntR family transcriptional regulator
MPIKEHERIVRALEAGDADEAVAAVADHLTTAMKGRLERADPSHSARR